MQTGFKKFLMAGTAIVVFGAASIPGEAFALCATSGPIAADCTFSDPATTGAITLDDNVDIFFSSTTSSITINNTIDAINLNGGSTVNTGGNGTIVFQSASDIGVGTAINEFNLNSGDFWFMSASTIQLSSAGDFNVFGSTLTLMDGSTVAAGESGFNGGANADSLVFGSASVPSASRNIVYASAFDLAGGSDLIDFVDGDGVMMVSSLTMGAGDDTIRFASGSISSVGSFGLGTGDDEIIFGSSTTSSTGLIEAASFDAGDGADTITFWDGGAITLTSAGSTFTMGAGNDTITFNSTSAVLGGGSITVTSGTFDLGAGNDTVNFNSGGAITADTFTGGTGTDTLNFNSSDYSLGADVSGVEAINVTDGTLTLAGDVTGGAITLSSSAGGLAAGLTIDDGAAGASDKTVTATITGGAGDQTVTINNGTVSGAISLGADNDTLTYSSGSMTGTVAMGTGTDVLNVAAGDDVAITAAISGVETINIQSGNILTLSAAITGMDSATQTGLDVAAGTLKINNGGSVDGTIFATGAGTVEFGADGNGGTFDIAGFIENVALVVNSGTVNTNGSALGAGGQALASIDIASGATLYAEDDVTSGGAFSNAGNLRVASDAQVTAVTYTNDDTGNYIIEIANNGGTLEAGSLDFGASNFTAGGGETFQIVVASGSGALTNFDGSVITFASGGTAVAPAATEVSDTSLLYDFTVGLSTDGNDDLTITVAQANTIESLSDTTNNATVANLLLTDPVLVASNDTTLNQLQAAVQGASTREAFNDALEQAQPTIDGSHMAAAMSVVNQAFNITGDRLASLRRGDRITGMATGNLTRGVKAWTQAFGVTGTQDRRDNIDGYDFDTIGAAFGADTENLLEDTVVGLGFSYGNTDADSANGSRTNTEVDSYQFTIYGDHNIDRRTYINGMFAYTMNKVNTSRDVGAATALGEFDANQYTTRVELGRDYGYRNATITPNVLGHWTHYDPDSYTETGAGGGGLTVDGDSVDVVELGVGVDASWLYRNSDGSYFSPELSAAYRYDLADDNLEMTSQFIAGGQSFTTEGFDPQQHTVDLGAGFTYYSTENWEFVTQYDYEWKQDFDSHAGLVRANYRF